MLPQKIHRPMTMRSRLRHSHDLPGATPRTNCPSKGVRQIMSIEFHNWIYLTDILPAWAQHPSSRTEHQRVEEIQRKVRSVLARLPGRERETIQLYYFEGFSIEQIAAKLGTTATRITLLLQRAKRRLKHQLADWVRAEFGVLPPTRSCAICAHPQREAIERLIAKRLPEEPYSRLFRRIRQHHRLKLLSPKTIISHMEYHRTQPETRGNHDEK